MIATTAATMKMVVVIIVILMVKGRYEEYDVARDASFVHTV